MKTTTEKRPMTLAEIIKWRKNSNGVILWGDMMVTTVDVISLEEEAIYPIHIELHGWESVDEFVACARKSDGSKFEVEE